MQENNISWDKFDAMVRHQAETRRCLHERLRIANARAGKLTHILFGVVVGIALGAALTGC